MDVNLDATSTTSINNPKAFYHRMVSLLYRKKSKSDKPVQKPPPKLVKTFTSLATTFLGAPTEIDDRANIVHVKTRTNCSVEHYLKTQRDCNNSLKVLDVNISVRDADDLPRYTVYKPTSDAQTIHSSLEQYPFIRRIENKDTFSPLPEPRLVFDKLLACTGIESSDNKHPNGMSSLTFSLATIISLSLYRVKGKKPEYNETSPFLDLSPLYGVNDQESDLIRAKDGRGMLSPDCFFEDRDIILPHAVSALLILWNRNHNYIARHLLLNNEEKKWTDPSAARSSDGIQSTGLITQDDEIFRIARLINCIHFKNVVSEDFLKILLGLPNVGRSTNLDILADVKQLEKGNSHDSSIEFSLLHNWSAMMHECDARVVGQAVEDDFGLPLNEFTMDDFENLIRGSRNYTNSDRRQRHLAGLQRNVEGRFNDEDLARILQDATECAAGTSGARRISPSFHIGEEMIIERARKLGVSSLNGFRKYLGLKVFKTFEEWNSDPDIAGAAAELYGNNIDSLELYPGLQAEETMPGSGLGLGYTMTYGLLVDIVTTIRSDPAFTTEMTGKFTTAPGKLTHWGFRDCIVVPGNGAFGAALPRLLQRNLPRQYPYNNIYGLFPLTCPDTTKRLLIAEAVVPQDMYDFERPKIHSIKIIQTTTAIKQVFNNPITYPTIYGNDLKILTDGYGYLLGMDDVMHHDRDLMMTMFALIPDKGALSRYASYFGKTAAALIKDKSSENNGHQSIDIVKDVINATCTRWACETLCGMKDSGKTATEVHDEFGAIFAYVFRNTAPEFGWTLRDTALKTSERLRRDIEKRFPVQSNILDHNYIDFVRNSITDGLSFLSRIRLEMTGGVQLPQHSDVSFLDRIAKANIDFPIKDLVASGHPIAPSHALSIDPRTLTRGEVILDKRRSIANVLGLAIATSIKLAQTCALAVDFYLDEKYSDERKNIVYLSGLNPVEARQKDANKQIMGYIREAQRLGQPLGLWRNVIRDDTINQGHGLPLISVRAGDRIYADFIKAHTNAEDFPNPEKVDPDRQTPSIQGMGFHKCLGLSFVDYALPELFKTIFRLKNLRREPGKAGRFEKLALNLVPIQTDQEVYVDSTGEVSHFPRSLILQYDNGAPVKASTVKEKSWKVSPGTNDEIRELRNLVNRRISAILLLVFMLLFVIPSHLSSFGSRTPKLRIHPPPWPKLGYVECLTPTVVFQPWDIKTFIPGPDGQPLPIEYTLNYPKPHKLILVDIDALDTQMAVYVDEELRGLTRDFEVNKTVNCGENLRACLTSGFSAGVMIVPPGTHTVRIEWIGKDFIDSTHNIDWGEERTRRIKWKKEYCA